VQIAFASCNPLHSVSPVNVLETLRSRVGVLLASVDAAFVADRDDSPDVTSSRRGGKA
jgi:hypothetical protein